MSVITHSRHFAVLINLQYIVYNKLIPFFKDNLCTLYIYFITSALGLVESFLLFFKNINQLYDLCIGDRFFIHNLHQYIANLLREHHEIQEMTYMLLFFSLPNTKHGKDFNSKEYKTQ